MGRQFTSLEDFQRKVADIARPFAWEAEFQGGAFAGAGIDKQLLKATIRTSSIPDLTLNEVSVNYFGMNYKLAGTPTYGNLAATFLIDNKYESYKYWQKVMDLIYTYGTDDGGACWKTPAEYMGTVTIYPLDQCFKDIAGIPGYVLKMAYLTGITAVQFSHDNKDQLLTFDATINFSYYQKQQGDGGGGG